MDQRTATYLIRTDKTNQRQKGTIFMKRICPALLALSLTLSLAACGAPGNGGGSASAPASPPAQEQET